MRFVFEDLAPKERYKLLVALVVPRPIALVTTLDAKGVANAAPFSFFNVFSEDPALVVLGIERHPERGRKDTAANIAATGAFVVNLVDEALAQAMNVCAVDFPPGTSELAAAGLTLAPSTSIAPGRIREAPAALECRHWQTIAVKNGRELIIGEVTDLHTRDGLIDPATLRVDWDAYHPIGRLFANLYCKTGDTFELVRESWEEWRKERSDRA